MRVFFDTNVIRYFGTAFATEALGDVLRQHVVLSPVSLVEVISQLALGSRNQAFTDIQAMWNWLPPRVAVLDFPPIFIRRAIFPTEDGDGAETFTNISDATERCLHARSADDVVEPAAELRRYIEAAKQQDAETRRDAVSAMRAKLRRERLKAPAEEDLERGFLASLANRAGADPGNMAVAQLANRLSAYYLYDTHALKTALLMPEYNFLSKKRKNDLFDSQQLLYLASPDLCFLTTDSGYRRVANTAQGVRIRLVEKSRLCERQTAIEEMELIAAH